MASQTTKSIPPLRDSSAPASQAFPDRFYPIVDSATRVAHLAALGARTIQLRIKDLGHEDALAAVRASLAAAQPSGARLVVNDYWQAAIEAGAHYLHLGQADLATADMAAIRRAGLVLGISTHDQNELDIALSHAPHHIALGPIFATSSKDINFAPQGFARLGAWKKRLGNVPLVAIGGITLETAPAVYAAGADSIAVIGDITNGADPDARVRAWLELHSKK